VVRSVAVHLTVGLDICLSPAGWLTNDELAVGCSAVAWLERGAQDRPK
jgi:hypothetical protein